MQLSLVDILKTLQSSVNKSKHIQRYVIPYTEKKFSFSSSKSIAGLANRAIQKRICNIGDSDTAIL